MDSLFNKLKHDRRKTELRSVTTYYICNKKQFTIFNKMEGIKLQIYRTIKMYPMIKKAKSCYTWRVKVIETVCFGDEPLKPPLCSKVVVRIIHRR